MRTNFRFSAVFLLPLSLLAVSGCKKGPQDGVAATVNGHSIMQADVNSVYDQQIQQQGQAAAISPDQENSAKLQVLQTLIGEEMVEQRAAKLGLTATDAEVDAKIAEMKAAYTQEQFDAKLKASNLTMDKLRHDVRRSLTQNKLLNKEINSKITVTDADVSTYYNAHKAEYNLIDTQYHLAQIVVTGQGAQQPGTNLQNNKASSDDEAKRKIMALKNRIDSGADFGVLAMNFSENPATQANQGDMGYASEKDMKADPAVYAAVTKLKAGEVTPILPFLDGRTMKPAGYAIYKLISKEPAGQRDLNDPAVQQAIRQQLQDSRSQLLKAAYFEILRDESKVENYFAEQVFKDTAK